MPNDYERSSGNRVIIQLASLRKYVLELKDPQGYGSGLGGKTGHKLWWCPHKPCLSKIRTLSQIVHQKVNETISEKDIIFLQQATQLHGGYLHA